MFSIIGDSDVGQELLVKIGMVIEENDFCSMLVGAGHQVPFNIASYVCEQVGASEWSHFCESRKEAVIRRYSSQVLVGSHGPYYVGRDAGKVVSSIEPVEARLALTPSSRIHLANCTKKWRAMESIESSKAGSFDFQLKHLEIGYASHQQAKTLFSKSIGIGVLALVEWFDGRQALGGFPREVGLKLSFVSRDPCPGSGREVSIRPADLIFGFTAYESAFNAAEFDLCCRANLQLLDMLSLKLEMILDKR